MTQSELDCAADEDAAARIEQLERTIHLLRSALDANEATIFVKDRDGKYVFINEAGSKRFGKPIPQILGQDATSIFDPENVRILMENDRRVVETGVGNTTERSLAMPGGPLKIFLASRAPYRDPEGNIVGVIGISRDITEQRHLEEIALQSQGQIAHLSRVASVGEMASTLAHELNQPLTAILSYAGVCLDSVKSGQALKSSAEFAEYLGELSKEANRAAAIIRRLRAYLSKGEGQRSPQDIHQPVAEAMELMRHELHRAGVKPQLEFAKDLPTVEVDAVQIQQVLINLTQNALDAMEKLPAAEKRLVVRISPAEGGMVRVSVIDGGSGVSEEICGKIFESYFTTKAKGLGLGLPICRSIVESHGGRLRAFANEDRGMTFEFTLPPAGQG